jgi:transposase
MANTTLHFVGIDVGKQFVDYAVVAAGESKQAVAQGRVERQEESLEQLGKDLQQWNCGLVVLEASGGYEKAVVKMLWRVGVGVAVVEPRRVRAYAKALGIQAKTDALDAGVLARFARDIRPPARESEGEGEEGREWQGLYECLVRMRAAEKMRLQQASDEFCRQCHGKLLETLEEQIEEVERKMAARMEEDGRMRERQKRLESAPGVGPKIGRMLQIHLPELGRLSHRQVGSLAGLAPMARDSGQKRGVRWISGGRAAVRTGMYLAAMSAVRCDGELGAFAQRLRERGKAGKQVLIAVAHKLLIRLNAMLRRGEDYQRSVAREAGLNPSASR